MFDFIKALVVRLPKFIASRPFKLFSMVIISIFPFVILYILNIGIREFSPSSIKNWAKYSVDMQHHIPSTVRNYKTIQLVKSERENLAADKDSISSEYDGYIESSYAERKAVLALKNQIKDKKIHSLSRTVYVGENQSFSMPYLDSCPELECLVTYATTNALIKRQTAQMPLDSTSLIFMHEWNRPGSYKVTLRSKANCTHKINEVVVVEVQEKPENVDLMELFETDKFVVSREAADFTVELLDLQLNELIKEKAEELEAIDNLDAEYASNIKSFNRNSLKHIAWLLTKIIVLFGLALLAAGLLSFVWTYFLVYEFDIYSFEQAEKHYYQLEYEKIRAKNPNQPLLGIFVLLIILVLVILCVYPDIALFCH